MGDSRAVPHSHNKIDNSHKLKSKIKLTNFDNNK